MKWGAVLGMAIVLVLMIWFEWIKIKKNQKKGKNFFVNSVWTRMSSWSAAYFPARMPTHADFIKLNFRTAQ